MITGFVLPLLISTSQLISKLRVSGPAKSAGGPNISHARTGSKGGGQIKMGGSTGSSTHTINEDERTEFTRHINAVLAGDSDIGDRLPFDTDTFQVC